MIGYVIFYGALALVALFIGALIYTGVSYFIESRKLAAAWKEYDDLLRTHGSGDLCPHRIFIFGQSGVPGVVVMTNKWCVTCKKDLGPAKLVESIFGNRWE